MARIRTVKPEFFTSADTMHLSLAARLLFIGLWCEADREGRMAWRPSAFQVRYLPKDAVSIEAVCDELLAAGLVVLYGDGLAYIPTFTKHQVINGKEAASRLPDPARVTEIDPRVTDASVTRPGGRKEGKEGKGREGKEDEPCASVVRMDSQWGGLPTRRKLHCAFESGIGLDVPQFLHDELLARLANAGTPDADQTLHAWYATTEAAYRGRVVGEDALRFWRARFAEWQGVTAKAAPVADDGWMPPVRKGAR